MHVCCGTQMDLHPCWPLEQKRSSMRGVVLVQQTANNVCQLELFQLTMRVTELLWQAIGSFYFFQIIVQIHEQFLFLGSLWLFSFMQLVIVSRVSITLLI